jgi:hypothetical protein
MLLLWLGGIYAIALVWRPMFGGWPVPALRDRGLRGR